jgi:hypothetical protein
MNVTKILRDNDCIEVVQVKLEQPAFVLPMMNLRIMISGRQFSNL